MLDADATGNKLGRDVPEVRSFRAFREHNHPLFVGRFMPSLFYPDVSQLGH